MVGSRLLARRTRRPATLIAARRLADNPQAGFRSISGLVLALFVASVAVGVIGTIVAERGAPPKGDAGGNLIMIFRPEPLANARVPAALAAVDGVEGAAIVHVSPEDMWPRPGEQWHPLDLALCADIARVPAFGRCAPGATVAWVDSDLTATELWPAADVTPEALAAMPAMSIVVATDGSRGAIERARTAVGSAFPQRLTSFTEAEWRAANARTMIGWQQLANVVILASLAIAGCSLAVSVAGGLTERKRPFSMLRLTGVPLGVLRRVVGLESAAPLLTAAVVAAGTGFFAAHLFLRAQMGYTVHAPGAGYYAITIAGLAAALGIIAATLPILRRITGPETARNE
ncbi:ABC transporter permease [Rhizomonospora bruguierae]|uniref:ABC transporter permease n=1 Tax=Rhizomonospora bruguierae TaxID=1581705 RepID=UPI0035E400F2